eukprot:10717573-Karenia_brevis.AAC.1
MRARRINFERQNPNGHSSLPWSVQIVDEPTSTDDRPTAARLKLDDELHMRYQNGILSATFLAAVDREAIDDNEIRECLLEIDEYFDR